MEENSSISSEEEELEYEGKGYTCEPEYSKDELIKLGIDVLEEKSDVRDDSHDIVMNLIQVDVKIYIGVHALTVVLCQPSSKLSIYFVTRKH